MSGLGGVLMLRIVDPPEQLADRVQTAIAEIDRVLLEGELADARLEIAALEQQLAYWQRCADPFQAIAREARDEWLAGVRSSVDYLERWARSWPTLRELRSEKQRLWKAAEARLFEGRRR